MRTELAWRAGVVLAAGAAVLADAPPVVRAPLALLAWVLVGEHLVAVQRVRHGAVRAVALVAGSTLVAGVLVGLLLDVLPMGLTRATWGSAGTVAGLVALGLAARAPAPRRAPPSTWPAERLLWAVVTGGVVAVALSVSVRSVVATRVEPLQASMSSISATSAVVTVSSGQSSGPFVLSAVAGQVVVHSYPVARVGPHHSARVRVAYPSGTRTVVRLTNPGQSQPLLTLDVNPGGGS